MMLKPRSAKSGRGIPSLDYASLFNSRTHTISMCSSSLSRISINSLHKGNGKSKIRKGGKVDRDLRVFHGRGGDIPLEVMGLLRCRFRGISKEADKIDGSLTNVKRIERSKSSAAKK
ncbi:hypothetical protein L2E82_01606 [Cichorium intybus]|uniref:Uncharacterized protein n=1 Tax=Cichorium intybus TaxID=13427 RepID=A0ACB9GZ24_CICIN|nr:hypothetical protein L2E82_01606 [Cichorium intybus]